VYPRPGWPLRWIHSCPFRPQTIVTDSLQGCMGIGSCSSLRVWTWTLQDHTRPARPTVDPPHLPNWAGVVELRTLTAKEWKQRRLISSRVSVLSVPETLQRAHCGAQGGGVGHAGWAYSACNTTRRQRVSDQRSKDGGSLHL
jgi:hypothetical protein